jgi:hypothetical protein
MDNYFSITDPDSYGCGVYKYVASLSVLHIRVVNSTKPPNLFYIVFYPVEYFSGPMYWQGANFQLAPDEECLMILSRLERYKGTLPEKLLIDEEHKLKLFTVKSPRNTIQIVAKEAKTHNEIWALV